MVRTTTSWATEESFKIYQGEGTFGSYIFSQPSISTYQTYSWTTCIQRTLHTIQMTDSYGAGWSSGSQVVISYNGYTIDTFHLPSGHYSTNTWSFSNIILITQMWKYSNSPQSSTAWSINTCTWETPTSYPPISTITRYFRYTLNNPSNADFGIHITVTTKYGFRAYLNGMTLFDHNVPEGRLFSGTQATAVTETAVSYSYSTLTGLFPAFSPLKYEFAIELHGTTNTTFGNESFSVSIVMFSSKHIISDSAAMITTSLDSGWIASERPELLFDNSLYTKWCVSVTSDSFPISITYRLPNNNHQVMTQYRVASANDMAARDCKSWKIYGSNDVEDDI